MKIKNLRLSKGLTQSEAATLIGLSLRTYQNYESGASHRDSFKINNIIRILSDYEKYTETKGIISIEEIKAICNPIFKKYGINYAYLFGSYAKNKAKEKSDIDIIVSNEAKGFDFINLQDDLNKALHKKIDLLRMDDIKNSNEFLDEILMTGIKIYGQN